MIPDAGMKDEYDPEMGKFLYPPERLVLVKGRKNFQFGAGVGNQPRLPGNAEFFRKAGAYLADVV